MFPIAHASRVRGDQHGTDLDVILRQRHHQAAIENRLMEVNRSAFDQEKASLLHGLFQIGQGQAEEGCGWTGCGNAPPWPMCRSLAIPGPWAGETEMSQSRGKPSPRAKAIAVGLVRTGRAAKSRAAAGFIRADGGDATYWISDDGARVLRGDTLDTAEQLQSGFLEAMARAGG
jgi:hypothetical protein